MFKRDILLRIIEQIVRVLARMLKLRDAGRYEEGLALAAETYREDFGLDPLYVDVMDSEKLAEMLGEYATIRALAQVVTVEAELLALSGDPVRAAGKRRRALELCLEAWMRRQPDAEPDEDLLDGVRGLLGEVGAQSLADKYRPLAQALAGQETV